MDALIFGWLFNCLINYDGARKDCRPLGPGDINPRQPRNKIDRIWLKLIRLA